ncbi:MAG TPA: RluA family pseudouridine synthase [Planctomycetes bacterium]|nr:RluA family pseudouridine synthase [Planctomycetota bacterium]HIL50907.1 RluA family pseudouridine synthase [Planctomycetota bacterium]
MGLFTTNRDLNVPPDRVDLEVNASALGQRVEEVELRLDAFLGRHLSWRSRTSIQGLVKDGFVLIDASTPALPQGTGKLTRERRPSRRVRHGTRVVVLIPPEQQLPAPEGPTGELDILHEDADCVAVDKPAGLAVHPSGRHVNDTLIQRVHGHYRASHLDHGIAPRLCHRLDRETSGIVLVAKNPAAHAALSRQFQERSLEKEYLAIVSGTPQRDSGVIDAPIGPARTSAVRLKMCVAIDGVECRTDWRVVRRHQELTLLACRLHTGRQHQIRVHLASIGLPIVGDKLYGLDEEYFVKHAEGCLNEDDYSRLQLRHQGLHNHRLVFRSPASGASVEVISPLPTHLREFLAEREWSDD